VRTEHVERVEWFATRDLRLGIDTATGLYRCRWANGTTLSGVDALARLFDGSEWRASGARKHVVSRQPFRGKLGRGILLIVRHSGLVASARPSSEQTASPLPPAQAARSPRTAPPTALIQRIWVFDDRPYLLTALTVRGQGDVVSNHLAPILAGPEQQPAGGVRLPAGGEPKVLGVPFDNDGYVRYNGQRDPAKDPDSYGVTALFDPDSRAGLVLGSLTHDTWKTGIEARDLSAHRVGRLKVYGGATGSLTRDALPHGWVAGSSITSPKVLVGAFQDWRVGIESYAAAHAVLNPPLPWAGGPIVGWNSWAAYGFSVTPERYLGASQVLKDTLQLLGFAGDATTYVNWDSGWDFFREEQLREGVRQVHSRGQKAGIYWCPFTGWGDDLQQPVEGTDGRWRYGDLMLKDSEGRLLPKVDGGHPLDPSHPGTLQRIDWQMRRFAGWGFDLVKLDFVHHGTQEGRHYNPRVTTGMQAYNLGMRRIVADLDPVKVGHPFFISLSIAPLFPAGYAHSRRISCDSFARLQDSEYMLNSLTYGWWMTGKLYHFSDPDHIVLYQARGQEVTRPEEGRTRLNSATVTGGMLLDSDDLTSATALARVKEVVSNRAVTNLARSETSFRPLEADGSDRATDLFVRRGPGRRLYLAAFNLSRDTPATKRIRFTRLGLNPSSAYRLRDLWTRRTWTAQTETKLELAPAESTIVEISLPQAR
jgi:hypothetical protein